MHLIASVNPRTVIEFGCNEGRAAATVMLNVPTITEYVGIDVEPGYVTVMPCQRQEIPAAPGKYALSDPRFKLLVRKNGSFDLQPTDLPRAQAIFIDADHSEKGVTNDTLLAMLCIEPGGIVIWHDDNRLPQVQVSETLDRLTTDAMPIVHVSGTWLAFRVAE